MEVVFCLRTIRPFYQIISCISKVNEFITIEFLKSAINITNINPTMSSFMIVTFEKEYFNQYERIVPNMADGLRCIKVNGKALLHSLYIQNKHMKSLEKLSMRIGIENNVEFLQIEFIWKPNTIKRIDLLYEKTKALHAKTPNSSDYSINFVSPWTMWREWTLPFTNIKGIADNSQHSEEKYEDLDICFLNNEQILLTSCLGKTGKYEIEIAADAEDAMLLDIRKFRELSIPLAELNIMIQLASKLNLPISCIINEQRKPMLLKIETLNCTCKMITSTGDPNICRI